MGEKRLAMPGEALAVEEEYVAGENVYEDRRGYLRSSAVGLPSYDKRTKVVQVLTKRRVRLPPIGSTLFGIISSVRSDFVTVELYGIVSLSPTVHWVAELRSAYTGLLAIWQIANEYVKDVHEFYRVGDAVLARTLSSTVPFHLTTKPPQYGVVYALCSKCLSIMEPLSPKSMRCPVCGNVEPRKVSNLASSRTLHIGLKRLMAQKRW